MAPVSSNVTYTAIVTNAANAASNGTVLTVQLPAGLSSMSVSFFGTYNAVNGKVTFTAEGMAASDTYTPASCAS